MIREPITRVMHFMRAMEYSSLQDSEVNMANLEDLGQEPYSATCPGRVLNPCPQAC